MNYTLSQDQKDWLQLAINLMQPGSHKTAAQNWLGTHDTATDAQCDALLALFEGDQLTQCQGFVNWLKGGVRPADPH